jgi:AsmA protein
MVSITLLEPGKHPSPLSKEGHMGKVIRWSAFVVGGLAVLFLTALILIPLFVDINQYKPEIEKQVAEATGRPFRLGGDLKLSLFPWAGISLSGLRLGNPVGFKEEKDFISVRSFEVRVKLLPLLFKDIQVKRLVMDSPKIVLIRTKDGRTNWGGLGKTVKSKGPSEERAGKEKAPPAGLPIKALAVEEFSITGGSVIWIDQVKDDRKEIRDFTLRLEDVSLTRPIRLHISAKLDDRPISVRGTVGPIGKEPGRGILPLAVVLKAFETLEVKLEGKLVDLAAGPRFDLALVVSPFSPRRLLSDLGQPLPLQTADPGALEKLALSAHLRGSPRALSLSEGVLELDQSHMTFEAEAKDLHKPDVRFWLKLDQMDLDRYLPPPSEEKPSPQRAGKEEKGGGRPAKKKMDYTPLRRMVLDGTVDIGKFKVHGAKMQDLHFKVLAKDGLIRMDPLRLKLYQGGLNAKALVDLREETPRSRLSLDLKDVQSGLLLRDVAQKDLIEGVMNARMDLASEGDEAERIKRTLNGKGELLFLDGAIKGIDLAGMFRNVKETFTLSPSAGTAERPRTDFAELHVPFILTNGLFQTPGAALKSPLLRVRANGKAHLAEKTLDFRVEPKFVATLKGQGDTMERTGLMVPVLVGGTFDSPTFAPDLKGIVKGMIPKPSAVEKLLPLPEKSGKTGKISPEEQIKGLMKRLVPFGGK